MLFIILDTENLRINIETAYEARLSDEEQRQNKEEGVQYFFDAQTFINCIENYYDTDESVMILVNSKGDVDVFNPESKDLGLLKIQQDAQPAKTTPSTIEKHSVFMRILSEYVHALKTLANIEMMGYSAIPAPFRYLEHLLGSRATARSAVQLAVCTPVLTSALVSLISELPLADLWTWKKYTQLFGGALSDRIELDDLVFNTGTVLSTWSSRKDSLPLNSIVIAASDRLIHSGDAEGSGWVTQMLHFLSSELEKMSIPVMRYMLAFGKKGSDRTPRELILIFPQETPPTAITHVYEQLSKAADLIDPSVFIVEFWRTYKATGERRRSGSSTTGSTGVVSSEGTSRYTEDNYSPVRAGFSPDIRPRSASSGVMVHTELSAAKGSSAAEKQRRRHLEKSTSDGEYPAHSPSLLLGAETEGRDNLIDLKSSVRPENSRAGGYSTMRSPVMDIPQKRDGWTQRGRSTRGRGRYASTSPPKKIMYGRTTEDHKASSAAASVPNTQEASDDSYEVLIMSKEEMDRLLKDEGFTRVSPRKKRPTSSQSRCRLKLYCGKQRAGVNCGYYHPRDELQKLRGAKGRVPRKIYLCKNETCRFQNEPEKCSYAHSPSELFCTYCEETGHHYAECPVANNE